MAGVTKISEQFDSLVFEMNPRDMMTVVQQVMKELYTMLRSICGQDIGADELFPAVVVMMIHSNIPELHRYIRFLHKFLSDNDKFGECGYCLITIEAAMVHIMESM